MANIVKLNYTADEINEKLKKINDIAQTIGDSETDVMSQKAVTQSLKLLPYTYTDFSMGGITSSGGVESDGVVRIRSGYIDSDSFISATVGNSEFAIVAYAFDKDKAYIGNVTDANWKLEITQDDVKTKYSNTRYIRLVMRHNTDRVLNLESDIKLSELNVIMSYRKELDMTFSKVYDDLSVIEESIEWEKVVPIFDTYKGLFISTEGTVISNEAFDISNAISVDAVFKVKYSPNFKNRYIAHLSFYETDNFYSEPLKLVVSNSAEEIEDIEVPENAKYLFVTIQNTAQSIETIELKFWRTRKATNSNSAIPKKILTLPKNFNLVVGDTFELFYKGISNVIDSNIYDYEISFSDGVSRGKAWKRNYEWTPALEDIGTKVMTIIVRDNMGQEIDRGTVNLVVSNTPNSPISERTVCCIGDSLTAGGEWCHELYRRMTSNSGTPVGYGLTNINFIGTKEIVDGCKFEGYGGWTFNSYLTKFKSSEFMNIYGSFDKTDNDQHSIYMDSNGIKWKLETIGINTIKIIRTSASGTLPTSGTLTWVSGGVNTENIVYTSSERAVGNPFWSEDKQSNDFVSYALRMGVSNIDHMIILLGWNSTYESETTYKSMTKQFIDGVLGDFPNCKITLVGLQVPSRDGFANNYGTSWKYYSQLQFVWNLNQWYQDIADEYDNVEFVNLAGQFDTEYNCLTMTKNPNVRNSTNITVQSNGVHPAIEGYYQIADAVLRNIITRLD